MSRLVVSSLRADRGAFSLGPISLTAEGPTLIGALGPNGAGKSTLLRALAGLTPASGQVSLDGQDLARALGRDRARRLAYLDQDRTAAWGLKARRVVELGRAPWLGASGRLAPGDVAAVDRALADTETTALAERAIDTLSGGERARVLLARALAVEAEVLLADEPIADLDPYHQVAVLQALAARARAGAIVIAALHDLALAQRFCDRVILVSEGRVVGDGPPDAVLDDAALSTVYRLRRRADGAGYDRSDQRFEPGSSPDVGDDSS